MKTTIEINLEEFFNSLNARNLEECEAEFGVIEETIHQCRVAIRNEKSRRLLQDEIQKKTTEDHEKRIKKHSFHLKRRKSRLDKATPYQIPQQDLIGH